MNITEYEQIGEGGAKITLAQVRKVPKYGPGCTPKPSDDVFIYRGSEPRYGHIP